MNILVVGSGIMGNGIAQTFAQAGNRVFLNDLNMDILEAAKRNIEAQLGLMLKNQLLDEQTAKAAMSNITFSDKLSDCSGDIDLVIEAIPEKLELKEKLFNQLEALCPAKTIFATNTSGISINTLAKGVKRKDRLIGTHFFMPAHLIPL